MSIASVRAALRRLVAAVLNATGTACGLGLERIEDMPLPARQRVCFLGVLLRRARQPGPTSHKRISRAGVKDAKKRGVKFGRKKKLGPAQIAKARKLIEAGEGVEDVAVLWNVGRTTLCATDRPYVRLSTARLRTHGCWRGR
jgi:hypothetical protein